MPCCAKKRPAEDFIDLESFKEIKKSKITSDDIWLHKYKLEKVFKKKHSCGKYLHVMFLSVLSLGGNRMENVLLQGLLYISTPCSLKYLANLSDTPMYSMVCHH